MVIVEHRINTIHQLLQVPTSNGIELDIRDKYNNLEIVHDAYEKGENWEEYFKKYNHKLCIANVKTAGVEQKIIQDFEKNKIENYFLLDVSLPNIVQLSKQGFQKIAIRYSEYEPFEFVIKFANKVNWVWIDCFTTNNLNLFEIENLKKHFKVCIVSPELQNHSVDTITLFKKHLQNIELDAVCTKFPKYWE